MNPNRALINFVARLESAEWALRDKLAAPPWGIDEGVRWSFPGVDLDDKKKLQDLADYIERKAKHIQDIGDCILFLKTNGEKGYDMRYGLTPEDVADFLKKRTKKYKTTKEGFIGECEMDYDSLLDDYNEIIKLIEYLMK